MVKKKSFKYLVNQIKITYFALRFKRRKVRKAVNQKQCQRFVRLQGRKRWSGIMYRTQKEGQRENSIQIFLLKSITCRRKRDG
jgi:hypothetical protein